MSMKPKSRLGRGLNSLISMSVPLSAEATEAPAQSPAHAPAAIAPTSETAVPESGVREIPLSQIVPNPHQPRRSLNENSLAELAASLKANGVIQAIVVRPAGEDKYELIAGERRWLAARLAGLETIPAHVREADAFTQAQWALVENIQREDLNPIDRASAYQTLMRQLGLTQAELANRMGEERSSIANYLRLNDLAAEPRELVKSGQLSLGHAKVLAGVDDVAEQTRLANLVISQELSVRNLEQIVSNLAAAKVEEEAPEMPKASPGGAYLVDLEKNISRQLGMRVQVKRSGNKGKGRLVIHYANLDQFDHLVEKMGINLE